MIFRFRLSGFQGENVRWEVTIIMFACTANISGLEHTCIV